jgi:drug/metabolite transporter (DMT)-like permease
MRETTLGILLVVMCAILEGFGQVFLKKSMANRLHWFMWISLGVIFLTMNALLYTKALSLLDVGVAYATSSLSLISVTVLSRVLLREQVTPTRWFGVLLIFVGVGIVVARA